jgi:hypothetical protein
MNLLNIYAGLKILEFYEEQLLIIFKKYLANELDQYKDGKNDVLLKKYTTFYKSCILGLENKNNDTEVLVKNSNVLLNILSHIATKVNLEKEQIKIVCKLIGNLKKIQLKLRNESTGTTDNEKHAKETAKSMIEKHKDETTSKSESEAKEESNSTETPVPKSREHYKLSINTSKYRIIRNILSDLIKNLYTIRSVGYIFDDSSNKYLTKYNVYECDKIVPENDTYYYNCIVKSLYDKVTAAAEKIEKLLKSLKKLVHKLHVDLKFCELKTIGTDSLEDDVGKYITLIIGDSEFRVDYLTEGNTYEEMINLITENTKKIPDYIKLICINILVVCQDYEVVVAINSIGGKNINDICDVIAEDLYNY